MLHYEHLRHHHLHGVIDCTKDPCRSVRRLDGNSALQPGPKSIRSGIGWLTACGRGNRRRLRAAGRFWIDGGTRGCHDHQKHNPGTFQASAFRTPLHEICREPDSWQSWRSLSARASQSAPSGAYFTPNTPVQVSRSTTLIEVASSSPVSGCGASGLDMERIRRRGFAWEWNLAESVGGPGTPTLLPPG